MTLPAKTPATTSAIEAALIGGDLSKLTQEQRVKYYNTVCESLGLNPLTQPFDYLTLNGKLQLYARRNCSDQLRSLRGVSIEIISRDVADGILTVHVRAKLPDGRLDEDLGAVNFPESLKGDARANAELKAITKAKRRVTLSICGLGFLDETEVADIPAHAKRAPKAAPNPMIPHDPQTGEIDESPAGPASGDGAPAAFPPSSPVPAGAPLSLEEMAREAAERGKDTMRAFWNGLTPEQKAKIDSIRPELNELVDAAEAAIAAE